MRTIEIPRHTQGHSLQFLTNLEHLVIRDSDSFDYLFIENLTKLVSLKDINSNAIPKRVLKKLTNIEVVKISGFTEAPHPVKDSEELLL